MSYIDSVFVGNVLQTLELLTQKRYVWELLYPKLVGDFNTLDAALRRLTSAIPITTPALTRARNEAIQAARPVFGGLRALQLDGHHRKLFHYTPLTMDALEALEHLPLLDALAEGDFRASTLWEELAGEMVTPADRRDFLTARNTYRLLINSAKRTTTGPATQQHAEHYQAAVSIALARLDIRVPRLRSWIPDFVGEYFCLRGRTSDITYHGTVGSRLLPLK